MVVADALPSEEDIKVEVAELTPDSDADSDSDSDSDSDGLELMDEVGAVRSPL